MLLVDKLYKVAEKYPAFDRAYFARKAFAFIGRSSISPNMLDMSRNVDGFSQDGYPIDANDCQQLGEAFLELANILKEEQ